MGDLILDDLKEIRREIVKYIKELFSIDIEKGFFLSYFD